jgi:transposase InsO family protein
MKGALLKEQVTRAFEENKKAYGTRRLRAHLQSQGISIGRWKIRGLMKQCGLCVQNKKKFRHAKTEPGEIAIFANRLDRQFHREGLNEAWVGDITYIPTAEGWLYLATMIDLGSRRIVGWAMAAHMRAELVCEALEMAVATRSPPQGLLVHTDRGAQYTGHKHRDLLHKYGFEGSMSRQGNCWDNAVAESFFSSLKKEQTQWRPYRSRDEAQMDILNYIVMYYNNCRVHSALGYLSPNQFERVLGGAVA